MNDADKSALMDKWQYLIPWCMQKLRVTADLHDDAKQIGLIALWKAAEAFDPSRGFQFSTLASTVIYRDVARYIKVRRNPALNLEFDYCQLKEVWHVPQEKKDFSVLHEQIKRLPIREREIVTDLYGLFGRPKMTLEEIGNQIGISKERVRQIAHRARKRMKPALENVEAD
jgi:RNA polymerase sigma factor, sigma-70 family